MKKRILFLCTGNSSRSQMAEAIINKDYSEHFEAFSAGSHPKGVEPGTISTLQRYDYPINNLKSKSLNSFEGQSFDFLISLCTSARSECGAIPGVINTISWDLAPPKMREKKTRFESTFTELKDRIHLFTLVHADSDDEQFDVAILHKCLSDMTRLMIIALLHVEKELSVGEISEALQQPQPKISRCLAYLKSHAILNDRRQGLWVFYSISSSLPEWAITILSQTVVAKHTQLKTVVKLLNAYPDRPQRDHNRA